MSERERERERARHRERECERETAPAASGEGGLSISSSLYLLAFESQPPHKIVNLLFTITRVEGLGFGVKGLGFRG